MDIELIEIQEFLASHPPFDQLPEAALARLPKRLTVRYFRRGSEFPPSREDGAAPTLFILRRGAIELRDANDELLGKLAEGDLCDLQCRPEGSETYVGTAAEDTLVYALPCAELDPLRAEHAAFAEHFEQSLSNRLRKALDVVVDAPPTASNLMTVRVRAMISRAPITATPEMSIREAAQIMTEHHVSSLLIMDGEQLVGMITDRDLRGRCLAAGLSPQRPVREIMTEKLCSVGPDTLGFEALLTMTRLNVHHLPVLDERQVVGLLSSTDLTRFQSANAVYLVGDIHRATSLEMLVAISTKIPDLQVHLVSGGATANQVGQAISAITDAITRRLLELAEAELGAPPVPYCWMVGGSQARREQSSHSDQDNALLIADHARPEDDAYFAALARIVNDGLHACGFIYCPGDVMASNAKWRQPLRIWHKYFANWIVKPEPLALMLASVFFDLRPLHDPENLFEELQARMLERSRANRIFIAYMAANALKNRPPLGFFRNIVLIHGGDHDHTFDIKHRGTVPIIDLARVYALSAGLPEINTPERLRAAADAGALSRDGAANLIDASEFIATLRVRHQVRQLRAGEKTDNFVSPDELSPLERGHLKDAFLLINTMQESLGQRHQTGRFA